MIEEEKMTLVYKLIMKSGPEPEKTYKLEKDEFVMGRELINDLIINDPEISRRHARLFKKSDRYFVEDLNSTNGTFIAGERISRPVRLKSGDTLVLGKGIAFEFLAEEIEEVPAVKEVAEGMVEKQEGTKEIKRTALNASGKNEKRLKAKQKPLEGAKKATASSVGEKLRGKPTWLIVLAIVLLFLLVFCVIPLLIVEWTDQWCNFFGTFFNQIQPGVCP